MVYGGMLFGINQLRVELQPIAKWNDPHPGFSISAGYSSQLPAVPWVTHQKVEVETPTGPHDRSISAVVAEGFLQTHPIRI